MTLTCASHDLDGLGPSAVHRKTTFQRVRINAASAECHAAYLRTRTRTVPASHTRAQSRGCNPSQRARNHRSGEGSLTSDEYRKAIASLGLKQYQAGSFLGYTARTSQAWANDERAVPKVVAMFLRLMLKHGKHRKA